MVSDNVYLFFMDFLVIYFLKSFLRFFNFGLGWFFIWFLVYILLYCNWFLICFVFYWFLFRLRFGKGYIYTIYYCFFSVLYSIWYIVFI